MESLLLIPTLVFPYTVCLCVGYGFTMGDFSDTNITVLGILALVTLVLSFICNLVYIIITRGKSFDKILNAALIIKILHIPTYLLIFALGVLMGFMFFMTFPFIIFLVFIDLITLWLSGMISVCALVKGIRDKRISSKAPLIIALVCQMFFCADIISAFVVKIIFRKVK